jgi:hypothetical protein
MAAFIAGWLVDDLLDPLVGVNVTLLLSFVISTVVFFWARRWLIDLRDG